MEILLLDPTTLTIHPALAGMPMLHEVAEHFGATKIHHHDDKRREAGAETALEWQAFCQDVAERGVQDPLKVVSGPAGWRVADGRHRLKAAVQAGLEAVPCVETTEEEIPNLIAANVLARRHVTKTARAWLAVTLFPEVLESKGGNRNSSLNEELSETQASLAARFGVSSGIFSSVCKLYRDHVGTAKFADLEWMVWGGAGQASLAKAAGYFKNTTENPALITQEPNWITAVKAAGGLNARLADFEKWAPAAQEGFSQKLGNNWARLGEAQLSALEKSLTIARQGQQGKPPKTEPLYTCPCCQQPGFLRQGLKAHRCPAKDKQPLSKGDLLAAMPNAQ